MTLSSLYSSPSLVHMRMAKAASKSLARYFTSKHRVEVSFGRAYRLLFQFHRNWSKIELPTWKRSLSSPFFLFLWKSRQHFRFSSGASSGKNFAFSQAITCELSSLPSGRCAAVNLSKILHLSRVPRAPGRAQIKVARLQRASIASDG